MTGRFSRLGQLSAALLLMSPLNAGAAGCNEGSDTDERRKVEQKVVLLERLLHESEPSRRVQASANAQAVDNINKAKGLAENAKTALDTGCLTDAARYAADGFQLATLAFRQTTTRSKRDVSDYDAISQQATSFLLSVQSQPKEVRGMSDDDFAGVERQLERAELLAADGNFDAAIGLLLPVSDRLQRRLRDILDQQTLYYETVFQTKQDEYDYLVEQYDGYMLLLKSGGRAVPYSARQRMDKLLTAAASYREQAEIRVGQADWPNAIRFMQEAIKQCERATQASGYMY